jgi:hypothetical protein
MSRFYRDLHDRELLSQAASVLQEVQDRKLLDIILPPDARQEDEDDIFPRRLASVTVSNKRLVLVVEHRFFQKSQGASQSR